MRRRRHAMACILGIFTILTVSAAAETVVDLNLFHSFNLRDTGTLSQAYLMAGDASVSLKSPNIGKCAVMWPYPSHRWERP